MAKKPNSRAKAEPALSYADGIKRLRQTGPERLYLLWGPEDYLREAFLTRLKAICLPEGEDSFSFRRFNGPDLDPIELRNAVDAVPFLTERSFVELRDLAINTLSDAEAFLSVLRDIPEYCTVAIVLNTGTEPDGRLKLTKELRELGTEIKFTVQPRDKLTNWVIGHFTDAGKSIDLEAAQHLLFVSGELMSRLLPEIEKIAAYAKGQKVTVQDVDKVASHIPEADVFVMTDYISHQKFDSAMGVLSDLLADKKNEPMALLALLSGQMRRLYTARIIMEQGQGVQKIMEFFKWHSDYPARKLYQAAQGYTLEQLGRAVLTCVEAEYKVKTGSDDREMLIEAVTRIAAGEIDEKA